MGPVEVDETDRQAVLEYAVVLCGVAVADDLGRLADRQEPRVGRARPEGRARVVQVAQQSGDSGEQFRRTQAGRQRRGHLSVEKGEDLVAFAVETQRLRSAAESVVVQVTKEPVDRRGGRGRGPVHDVADSAYQVHAAVELLCLSHAG